MKNGLLGLLTKLSRKKNVVTYQVLNNEMTGFKALPKNGKRRKEGEVPETVEFRFLCSYEDAKAISIDKAVAFIVWVDRSEYDKAIEADKAKARAAAV